MKNLNLLIIPGLSVAIVLAVMSQRAHSQGSLTPPGPPAPSQKTLDQVEARTPIPGGGTYTISSPGSYYLTGNITTSESGDSAAGIRISASNVTLDLNGFTVTGLNDPTVADYGIHCAGAKNIAIRNGHVKQAEVGVFIVAPSGVESASGIRVENVNCHQVFLCGIYSSGPVSGSYIHLCTVDTVGGSSKAFGCFAIYGAASTRVDSCVVTNVTGGSASGGVSKGVGIDTEVGCFCTGNTISNCDVGIARAKCQNNLTLNCGTSFSDIVDAGGNN